MIRTTLATACVLLIPGVCRGDGLLYQLAADGTSAEFQMKITDQSNNSRMVRIVMRSVGKTSDEEGSRWIEFTLPAEEATQVVKVLIPEKRLKEGESPVEHVIRGWRKRGDETPAALQRTRDFWLLLFLAGPLEDVKKLKPAAIASSLGELECAGVTGRAHVREDDGYEEDLAYEIRRHAKAPFGVVSCRIACDVKRDGKVQSKVTYELTLSEVKKGVESELPGYE